MPDTTMTESVNEAEIGKLLERLARLREQLAVARAMLVPLEEGLNTAYREYQNELRPLRRRIASLQEEINELRHKIETAEMLSDSFGDFGDLISPTTPGLPRQSSIKDALADTEAREKDELLQHLYWVLDP